MLVACLAIAALTFSTFATLSSSARLASSIARRSANSLPPSSSTFDKLMLVACLAIAALTFSTLATLASSSRRILASSASFSICCTRASPLTPLDTAALALASRSLAASIATI